MKTPAKWSLPFLCMAALTAKSGGDPAPQPLPHLIPGAQDTMNVDWEGVAGRTYFMQFSMNLTDWHYAPFIEYGEGARSRGLASDAVRMFFRLTYEDIPGINSLDDAMNADFDGDGLSNIFEVTHGYDPYDIESTAGGPDSSHDPDEDGLGNADEHTQGTNPMTKDNPILQLEVTVD